MHSPIEEIYGHWSGELNSKPRLYVISVRPRMDPKAAPIAYVMVDRKISSDPSDSGDVSSSTIELNYHVIGPDYQFATPSTGSFRGKYQRGSNTVSLTGGAVFMDPDELRGNRIGTYLFSQVIQWAMQWPQASVLPIKVNPERDQDNRVRRDQMYKEAGIEFDPVSGESLPMKAGALKLRTSWQENIEELRLNDCIAKLVYERNWANNEHRIQCLHTERAEEKLAMRERCPIIFALDHIWKRITSLPVLGALAIAVSLGLVWRFQ